jgi:hypothetical protein
MDQHPNEYRIDIGDGAFISIWVVNGRTNICERPRLDMSLDDKGLKFRHNPYCFGATQQRRTSAHRRSIYCIDCGLQISFPQSISTVGKLLEEFNSPRELD